MRFDTSPTGMILVATSGGKWVRKCMSRLIHPNAWKGCSAKFACRGFSEVREPGALRNLLAFSCLRFSSWG